ncbi:uncharacterized protein LOC109835632 isoform X3 [Asparagus officinalis]|uniref:uncharacterized protein LOC109835632 isoform X3 n=1 Tax=Asparagus officinalis TaxID=4686 RepID=UPI00098E24D2|nr:uncharacterized protein LOC109835632 isoform X3 [Asparagus officinalis]XP_020259191.1 uncharacterized protein LOC109835632 isoform X3 [Asparagus officinalis]
MRSYNLFSSTGPLYELLTVPFLHEYICTVFYIKPYMINARGVVLRLHITLPVPSQAKYPKSSMEAKMFTDQKRWILMAMMRASTKHYCDQISGKCNEIIILPSNDRDQRQGISVNLDVHNFPQLQLPSFAIASTEEVSLNEGIKIMEEEECCALALLYNGLFCCWLVSA